MKKTNKTLEKEIIELRKDMNILKKALLSDGELTPAARQQLKKARKEHTSSYTPLDSL